MGCPVGEPPGGSTLTASAPPASRSGCVCGDTANTVLPCTGSKPRDTGAAPALAVPILECAIRHRRGAFRHDAKFRRAALARCNRDDPACTGLLIPEDGELRRRTGGSGTRRRSQARSQRDSRRSPVASTRARRAFARPPDVLRYAPGSAATTKRAARPPVHRGKAGEPGGPALDLVAPVRPLGHQTLETPARRPAKGTEHVFSGQRLSRCSLVVSHGCSRQRLSCMRPLTYPRLHRAQGFPQAFREVRVRKTAIVGQRNRLPVRGRQRFEAAAQGLRLVCGVGRRHRVRLQRIQRLVIRDVLIDRRRASMSSARLRTIAAIQVNGCARSEW